MIACGNPLAPCRREEHMQSSRQQANDYTKPTEDTTTDVLLPHTRLMWSIHCDHLRGSPRAVPETSLRQTSRQQANNGCTKPSAERYHVCHKTTRPKRPQDENKKPQKEETTQKGKAQDRQQARQRDLNKFSEDPPTDTRQQDRNEHKTKTRNNRKKREQKRKKNR